MNNNEGQQKSNALWKALAFGMAAILMLVMGVKLVIAQTSTQNNLEITPLSGNWSKPDKFVLKNISDESFDVEWRLDCSTEAEGRVCSDEQGKKTLVPNETYQLGFGLVCAQWIIDLKWNSSTWRSTVEPTTCATGTPSPSPSLTPTTTPSATVTPSVTPVPTTSTAPTPTTAAFMQRLEVQKRVRLKGATEWVDKLTSIPGGKELEFEIVVKNTGEADVSNIKIIDVVPDNLELTAGPKEHTVTLVKGQENRTVLSMKTNTKGVANNTEKCVDNVVNVIVNNDKYASDTATVCVKYVPGQTLAEQDNLPETGVGEWFLYTGIFGALAAAFGVNLYSKKYALRAQSRRWPTNFK